MGFGGGGSGGGKTWLGLYSVADMVAERGPNSGGGGGGWAGGGGSFGGGICGRGDVSVGGGSGGSGRWGMPIDPWSMKLWPFTVQSGAGDKPIIVVNFMGEQ